MTDAHILPCRCGACEWHIAANAPGTHIVCHCKDCRAAMMHLGAGDRLVPHGGTALFQTVPAHITIAKGAEHLAILQLSPKGLFRWYAACCDTPMGNTLGKPGFSFCGVVLPAGTEGFGPLQARVFTEPEMGLKNHGFALSGLKLMWRALRARITGQWRDTPFFDDHGQPRATPRVLTMVERATAERA